MKKIILFLLGIASLCSLSGCIFNSGKFYRYSGEFKDLYATAIYSIPDAVGYMDHGEGVYTPDIYVWEQDDYGRTLFSYCEDYGNQIFALVLLQYSDETNVFFYSDINYALILIDSNYFYEGATDNHLKNKTEDFYLENRDRLKEKNDWNKPIDKSKCISYSITDHKILGENIYSLDETQCNKILNEYTNTLNFVNPNTTPYRYGSILQVDSEGRVLHEIYGTHVYYDKLEWNKWDPYARDYTCYDIILWVITDNNGNYDKENGIMVMYSKANDSDHSFVYNADDVLEFKTKNGWKN